MHYVSMDENAFAYKTEGHRHRPEIEQELAALGSADAGHLRPAPAAARPGRADQLLRAAERADLQGGGAGALRASATPTSPSSTSLDGPPGLRDVRDTNECHVYVTVEERGRVLAFSAIDNLWKGASGQAVQNLNLMLGLDETGGAARERAASSGRAGSSRRPESRSSTRRSSRPASAPARAHCGLKGGGKTDVGLLVCDAPRVSSALLLTRNASAAAPVRVCRDRVDRGAVRAAVVNSGNANAETGEQGLRRRLGDVRAGRRGARPATPARSPSPRPARSACRCRSRRCWPGSARPPARSPPTAAPPSPTRS